MNSVISPVVITSTARQSRWDMTPREEQLAAKWAKPSAVYGDVVMYQTLLQLLHLAFIPLGLLAVAAVVAALIDATLWTTGRPPYFQIDSDVMFYLVGFPQIGLLTLESIFTSQIAKLKYIGQLQERLSGQASHG